MPKPLGREVGLPRRGLHQHAPLTAIPPGFTPSARNVRMFDPLTDREGIAKREGLSKRGTSRVSGVAPVRAIAAVNGQTQPTMTISGAALLSEPFTYSDGNIGGSWANATIAAIPFAMIAGGTLSAISTAAGASSPLQISSNTVLNGSTTAFMHSYQNAYDLPSVPFVVEIDVANTAANGTAARSYVGICLNATNGTVGNQRFFAFGKNANGDIRASIYQGSSSSVQALDARRFQLTDFASGTHKLRVYVASTWIGMEYANRLVGFARLTHPSAASQRLSLFMTAVTSGEYITHCDNLAVYAGSEVASQEFARIYALANGVVAYNDASGDPFTATTGETYTAANRPRVALGFGDQTQTGDQDRQYLYIVDGNKYLKTDLVAKNTRLWVSSNSSYPLPNNDKSGANIRATLITFFQDRCVLSGVPTDPYTLFFSRRAAPMDFNTSTAASDPRSARFEPMSDVITCLAPHSDDLCFVGCRRSLILLRGDPGYYGTADSVLRNIGIVGGDAWTRDTEGFMYFVSTQGLIMVHPSDTRMIPLSRGRTGRYFENIDYATSNVRLVFDHKKQLLRVLVEGPTPNADTEHLCWDKRSDSFVPDTFPAFLNPTAAAFVPDCGGSASCLLLGGWDGFVRVADASVTDDDGEDIGEYVDIGPIVADPGDEVMVNRIEAWLGQSTNGLPYAVYAADDPSVIDYEQPIYRGEWTAPGRGTPDIRCASGGAVVLRLGGSSLTKRWHAERMTLGIGMAGPRR